MLTRETKSKELHKVPEKSKLVNAQDELLAAATGSTTHRLWTRTVIILAVAILVYFYTKRNKETIFASFGDRLSLRLQKFKCSSSYAAEISQYPKCVPEKCGRFVTDVLIEPPETELLLDLAQRVIGKAGSSGGASVLDLQTGALSHGEQFVNLYQWPEVFSEISNEHRQAYTFVKGKIKLAIAEQFGIPAASLFLTTPTFFSRLTNVTAKTLHDEYWHEHVDKETYPSFHYTSLLYLNTYRRDFKGGRFIFVDGLTAENRTTAAVEPKAGRVSAFTSGAENRHHVEMVTSGERFAVTISFTCNPDLSIKFPQILAEH